MSRILSGMQPTQSRLHLGNYEGALKNWVKLQEQYDLFCCVVDWHALTTMSENPHEIAHNSREVAKDYIAAGIDPKRSAIFIQSHVKEHAELHLLLSMVTPIGWLERVPTYKEKLQALYRPGSLFSRIDLLCTSLRERQNVHVHESKKFDGIQPRSVEKTYDEVQVLNETHDVLIGLGAQSVVGELAGRVEPALHEALVHGHDDLRESLSATDWLTGYRHVAASLDNLWRLLIDTLPTGPYGLLGYPVLQAADILLYKPYGVPVGKDQAPHLEISREIARRFNHLYKKEVFPEFKNIIGDVPVLMGTDGRKMSKSYDNSIYLNETEDETAKKIMGSFTTPTKMRKTDPGEPENCAVCNLLKIYSGDWQTQWEEDRQGIRGCMLNKKECVEAVNEALRPMRERRKQLDDSTIEHILEDGANRAREVAAATMNEVREAMGLR